MLRRLHRSFVLLLFLSCVRSATAQTASDPWASDRLASDPLEEARHASEHSILFPLSLLVPAGLVDGYDLRDYIASRAFGEFGSTHSPEETFDEIYFTALTYAHGDTENAMLAAAYGSFEHESIPFRFFGGSLDIPLTSETKARFLLRRSHLPMHLYHIPEGDQDKPQHFFSSAWLKETVKMDWLVKLLGNLVEEGENAFLVGGSIDPRDEHANHDGLRFAIEAERLLLARPSLSLTPNP